MTESEKTVVQKLLLATSGKIKFYCRYVDDTLCYGNDVLLFFPKVFLFFYQDNHDDILSKKTINNL